ncbi:MAG: hypothetical protein ACLTAR_07110, partial [Proteus mirabilis]
NYSEQVTMKEWTRDLTQYFENDIYAVFFLFVLTCSLLISEYLNRFTGNGTKRSPICGSGNAPCPYCKSPFYLSISVIIIAENSLYYSPRPLLGEGFFLQLLSDFIVFLLF